MKRNFIIVGVLMSLLLIFSQSVYAHSTVVNSEPKSDALLTTSPQQVKILFNEQITAATIPVTVTDENGDRVDLNDGAVSKENVDMLQVSLNSPLKPGIYQVNWSIIADDGDPVKGNFKFTVGNASSTEKQQDDVGVKVDGTLKVFPDAKPYVDQDSGHTMVPVRFVSEALGADVAMDKDNTTVKITRNGKQISLMTGSNTAIVDGNTVALDTGAVLKDSRLFVPVRFISESFGVRVDWDADTRTVLINTK
ncbi:stalk domain-containing protein [Paenibacillus sp. GP183]|uniref:stalk domain-containing protein n=1 Tax=Paenibacillus sp. GP183 TaxID=1882751 RepID=UPI000898EF23|nr:stalk domain-containing protein [Paenibacillus sp. GP183]SEC41947.1 Copper-binding protein CopC (methionine-rich) [Paenibacillus sp. GP183]